MSVFPDYTCKPRTERKIKTLVRLGGVPFFLQFPASGKLKSFVEMINEGVRKSWVGEKPVIYIPA